MLNERLKVCRQLQGRTQKELSEFLEIAERAYQNYEYGKREPNIATIIKLCNYFNVSADYLLGLTDNPERR